MKIMKSLKSHTFIVVGIVSLCLGNFSSIIAMDADNMFGMYDAYDDSNDSSMSYSPSTYRDSDSYDHSNDVSMDSGVTDKESDSSDDSLNDVSMNESDYVDIGSLHKSVNNLKGIENPLMATFYKDIDLSKDYNRRLIKRIDSAGKDIESGDTKTKRSSVLEPLANKKHFAGYDFYVEGFVHPQTKKTELYGDLQLYLNHGIDDELVNESVNEIIKQLEKKYGIKEITSKSHKYNDFEEVE